MSWLYAACTAAIPTNECKILSKIVSFLFVSILMMSTLLFRLITERSLIYLNYFLCFTLFNFYMIFHSRHLDFLLTLLTSKNILTEFSIRPNSVTSLGKSSNGAPLLIFSFELDFNDMVIGASKTERINTHVTTIPSCRLSDDFDLAIF